MFLSLAMIFYLGAKVQNKNKSFVHRVSYSYIYFVAFVIISGVLAGLLSFRMTNFVVRVLMGIVFSGLIFLNIRVTRLRRGLETVPRQDSFIVTIIPGIFLFSVGLVFALKSSNNMHFLLNTWDGTTNPGIVTALRYFEQINSFPEVKGIEGYPAGMHYLASWLADMFPTNTEQSSLVSVQAFSATILLVYTFIIALVGEIALQLSRILHLNRIWQRLSLITPQAILLTPFLLENFLLIHSLAFLAAIATSLSLILILIENAQSPLQHSSRFESLLAISLAMFILVHTYPTFLLFGFCVFITFVVLPKTIHLFKHELFTYKGLATLVLGSATLSLVLVQLIIAGSPSSLSPVSRFSLSAHIIALDFELLLLMTFLSLFVCLTGLVRKLYPTRALTLPLFGVIMTVAISWFLSNSFDRSYGPNYYAKKSEYQLMVLLLPVASCGFYQIINFVSDKSKKSRSISSVFLIITAIGVTVMIHEGLFESFIEPATSNNSRGRLMNYALTEANRPGRSIVWDDAEPYYSIHASMMSVQLDPTSWLEPDIENLFLIMAQQLSVHDSTKPWTDSCGFLKSRNFGKGRIVDINKQNVIRC